MKVAPFVLIRNFFPLPLSYPTRSLTVFQKLTMWKRVRMMIY